MSKRYGRNKKRQQKSDMDALRLREKDLLGQLEILSFELNTQRRLNRDYEKERRELVNHVGQFSLLFPAQITDFDTFQREHPSFWKTQPYTPLRAGESPQTYLTRMQHESRVRRSDWLHTSMLELSVRVQDAALRDAWHIKVACVDATGRKDINYVFNKDLTSLLLLSDIRLLQIGNYLAAEIDRQILQQPTLAVQQKAAHKKDQDE